MPTEKRRPRGAAPGRSEGRADDRAAGTTRVTKTSSPGLRQAAQDNDSAFIDPAGAWPSMLTTEAGGGEPASTELAIAFAGPTVFTWVPRNA